MELTMKMRPLKNKGNNSFMIYGTHDKNAPPLTTRVTTLSRIYGAHDENLPLKNKGNNSFWT
jgi:hypothetical protein